MTTPTTPTAPIATTAPPQTTASQLRSGMLFAIAGTALFSVKSIFIKLAFQQGIDATTLLTLRMLIAMPFYLLILGYAIKTRPHKAAFITQKTVLQTIGLGFLGYYLASWLDFVALGYITAQLERLTLFTYPVMVALLSWIFFREKITLNIILSLIVSYAGISLLFSSESSASTVAHAQTTSGALLVALAALSFSIYVIFSKALITRLGSLIFTSIAMSSSSVFISIHFLATHPLSSLIVSAKLWGLAFLLAIFSTLIPSFLTSEAIHRIGATRTSITGTLGPVITILLAVNILGEPFGWAQVIGLLLVLLGVSLLRIRTQKK